MDKIDFRRHYILVFDTETANTMAMDENGGLDTSNVLMYDCGWSVVDTRGNVYLERSFVNKDIFEDEEELMRSAYYGWKRPRYEADLEAGSRIMSDTHGIRNTMLQDMDTFHINEVVAHNSRFDINALNTTLRYISKSKYRHWFPYGTIVWDTMKMARDVMHKMPTYQRFCAEHNLLTASGKLSTTAESLYKYITKNPNFVESHTGLEDVQIEREIMFYCYKQHKAMRKLLWENQVQLDPPTDLQKIIMKAVKGG